MSGLVQQQGYARGRATRQVILEAATAMFGEVGFTAASLREIAARSGISHPGLLHHFPSKQDLLLAVLEHREGVDAARFDPAKGADTLWRLVDVIEESVRQPGMVELVCVLSAEATTLGHPARAYFAERQARYVAGARRALEAARDAGDLRPGVDPERAAVALVAMVDGLQVHWLLNRDGVDMPGVLRTHLASLLAVVPERVGDRA